MGCVWDVRYANDEGNGRVLHVRGETGLHLRDVGKSVLGTIHAFDIFLFQQCFNSLSEKSWLVNKPTTDQQSEPTFLISGILGANRWEICAMTS